MSNHIKKQFKDMTNQISEIDQIASKAQYTAIKIRVILAYFKKVLMNMKLDLADVQHRNRRNNLRIRGIWENADKTDLLGYLIPKIKVPEI